MKNLALCTAQIKLGNMSCSAFLTIQIHLSTFSNILFTALLAGAGALDCLLNTASSNVNALHSDDPLPSDFNLFVKLCSVLFFSFKCNLFTLVFRVNARSPSIKIIFRHGDIP